MASGNPAPHQATTNQNAVTAEIFVDTVRSLVRPFLAVSFTYAAIRLTFSGMLPASVIGTAATAIASFYFGERSVRKGILAEHETHAAPSPAREGGSGSA
ncbi:MAG: hypothetical protein ETSY2_34050 [Candidatus Entotheonella gemina]|uniref:Uncharacterized protein n=1 Tax=Candidatus Entotheonella gemina TaxID=1429439 RepID=W4LZ28_9BACT|nr:MAG: hypothetical protein ETSY2_34050 [Candidatus Entotheonella gemina]